MGITLDVKVMTRRCLLLRNGVKLQANIDVVVSYCEEQPCPSPSYKVTLRLIRLATFTIICMCLGQL